MKDNLIKPAASNLPVQQNAEKIVNVEKLGELHQTNQFFLSSGAPGKRGATITPISFSRDYYNLIVYGDSPWFEESGHITLTKDCVLVEDYNMDPELKTRFSPLTPECIQELVSFPCILAYENTRGGKTTSDHQAVISKIIDVKNRSNGIEIYFSQPLFYVDQQRLNELSDALGIKGHSGLNELGHSHWSVKAIDLFEVINEAGLNPTL